MYTGRDSKELTFMKTVTSKAFISYIKVLVAYILFCSVSEWLSKILKKVCIALRFV